MAECIFCKIVDKKAPAEIVYEDDLVLAFEDIRPLAPVHVLVIPKRHIPTLLDLGEDDNALCLRLLKIAGTVASIKGVAERGFRIVVACNSEGGQEVYHLHLHVLGGRPMRWPAG